MKRKLGILFLLIILFGIGVLVKFFVLDAQAKDGKLKVLASPAASIFLNDKPLGKTPYEAASAAGEYILKLIPEGSATEAASWQGKISIYQNTLTYVDRELGSSDLTSAGVIFTTIKMPSRSQKKDTGEVEVETEPAGAIVYLDNDEKGISPLILSEVSRGDHELSVYVPGFFRRTQKINIEPAFRTSGKFKLALDQSQKKIEDFLGEEATESASVESESKDTGATIVIKDTPTGWLRVREEPSVSASESARVNPKDTFAVLDEKDGWYLIEYEKGKKGWVSGQYAQKQS